jgi:folate-dependent phosphoribosylglycinamide formyltransferase PurN
MPRIAVVNTKANYNLDVLLEAHSSKNLKDGEISLVATASAEALARVKAAKVQTLDYGGDEAALSTALAESSPDLIVVLDRPHHLSADFLKPYGKKVIALHPALAGEFPNADAVEAAFAAYQRGEIKWTGCNVHFVEPEGKTGKVMRQIVVPVEPKDTPERFEERMRQSEAWLLLKAIKQFLYELRTNKKTSKSPKVNTEATP